MPTTKTERYEIWVKQADGSEILQEVIETEVEVPTAEEEIAEKEAQLLAIYEELQVLKNQQ